VSQEPPRSAIGNDVERSRFFEEVSRARDYFQGFLTTELVQRIAIQGKHVFVSAAADEQRRGAHMAKLGAREVGPAATRPHRRYATWIACGTDQRGRSAGARAEVTDPKFSKGVHSPEPTSDLVQTFREQLDVEPEVSCLSFLVLFVSSEQVE